MQQPSRPVRRRTLLRSACVAGMLGIAGCLSDGDDGDGDQSPSDDDSDPSEDADAENGDDDETGDDATTDDQSPNGPVEFEVEAVVDSLEYPWGIAAIPDEESLLVTERTGQLRIVEPEGGTTEVIDGTPEVTTAGQGGLLDVAFHPEYPDEDWVYLTYSAGNEDGDTATHLGRGRLPPGESALEAFDVIHIAEPFVDSTAHYGSRVVFGEDGMVYMTSGDRQFKDFGPDHVAQDTTNELGAVLRLEPDGSIPDDNPFVDDDDVVDSIFSYGHRNPQGLTVHPETGELWESEHGEEDGDVIHVLQAGGNYGWPIAHYACHYGTDDPVAEDEPHERDDIVDPVHYWECGSGGFPPAGMTFYDGEALGGWQGDLFVGTLAGTYLGHFAVDGHDVEELDPLLDDRDWRVRAVVLDPESEHLYVAVDDADAPLVRLVPG